MTSTKSAEAISPLRRRMIEDMTVRKFSDKTRHDYIRYIASFAKFLGRSPDTATAEDLRRYQVHQTESGIHPSVVPDDLIDPPRPALAPGRQLDLFDHTPDLFDRL
jgi:hypothetical protein